MNLKNKKILVPGGAGFLGSNLCKSLLEKEAIVICLDNLYTGRAENIIKLNNNTNFSFINHDIINPIDLPVDFIANLACPASPPHYQKDPIFTTKTNVIGTLNMLNLAKKYKAPILLTSTSEVYGDPLEHPQTEHYRGNVNPIGIRACYDEGKRCAEALCFDYQRKYGLDIKVVRIFNTYGPNMDPMDGRVVSNFILQALQNKPITIYGDGTQTRSFCYVDDLIDGIIKMMEIDNFTGPVNLGNPNEYNLTMLAKIIIKLTNSASQITYHPLPQDDPTKRCPDITLAKEKLNWHPPVQLEEGLQKTILYFKNILDKNVSQPITQTYSGAV